MKALCVIELALACCVQAEDETHPLEPADTSSPRATLHSFMEACNDLHQGMVVSSGVKDHLANWTTIERVIDCLDLSESAEFMRTYQAREAAVCLKEVFDRIGLPPEHEIPGAEEVAAADDMDLARWTIPQTEITIARVTEGPQIGQYLFSPETVEHASDFYRLVEALPYKPGASEGFLEWVLSEPGAPWLTRVVRRLPGWTKRRAGGQAIWQWVGLALVLAVMFVVMTVFQRLGVRCRRMGPESGVWRYGLSLVFPLLAVFVPVVARDVIELTLNITGSTLLTLKFSLDILVLVSIVSVLMAASTRVAEIIIMSPRINPKSIDAQFIRLSVRVLGVVAAVIVFLEGGKMLGIPVTTLLAGAGVGGLAVALAAQDALKNIMGSMMIILDRPYRIGERIVAKGYDGVVEEIGMRSTKMRLLTGHQATIPNNEMAQTDIENIGRRPHIKRVMDLALTLDTPPAKAEEAVEILSEVLKDHEGMEPDFPPRVWFSDILRDALGLRAIYWYHPPAYWDFTAHAQKVNARILREFDQAGIRLAPPTTTSHLAQDTATPLRIEWTGPPPAGRAREED